MFVDKDYISAMDEINKKILEEPVSLDTPLDEIKGYLIDCSELITAEDNISPKTNQVILSLFEKQEITEKTENKKIAEDEDEEDEDIQENQKFIAEEEIDEEEEIKEEIKLIKEKKIEKPEKRTDEKKKEGKKNPEEFEPQPEPQPEMPQKRKRGRPKRTDITDITPSVNVSEMEEKISEVKEEPISKTTPIEKYKSLEAQKALIKESFPELNSAVDASLSELEEVVENFIGEFTEATLFIKDSLFGEIYKSINQIKELKSKSIPKYEKPNKKKGYQKKTPKKGKRGVGEYLESILDKGPLNVEKVADALLDKFNYETSEIAREAIRRHIWRLKDEGVEVSYDNHVGEYKIEN